MKNLFFVSFALLCSILLAKDDITATTLLKILIGIENPTSGRILKKEKDITKLDSSKRGMGIVFQNYALFPNMTVLDNVMYALNLKLKNNNPYLDDLTNSANKPKYASETFSFKIKFV